MCTTVNVQHIDVPPPDIAGNPLVEGPWRVTGSIQPDHDAEITCARR
jgi:hypothetical protein